MSKTILVTGCGGDIGIAIGRILKESFPTYRIAGADMTMDGPGHFVFDSVDELPPADDARYFSELKDLADRISLDLIIPMSEPELREFFRKRVTDAFEHIPVVMANPKTFEFSFDKLKTSQLLDNLGLPYPWTRLVEEDPVSYPCIVKNRGLMGKGGVELADRESVSHFRRTRPNDLWQEYLKGDEYTCGLYGTRSGEIRTIIFKRQLSNGTSGFTSAGVVVANREIEELLEALGAGMNLRGSCNIQLRLTERGPMIFEINPRFSSTVMFRHKLGFKDVIWSCSEAFGGSADEYIPPRTGIRFYKGYTEYIED